MALGTNLPYTSPRKLTKTEQAIEWYKCKINPFYFIYNYCYIPEIGGQLKYDQSIMHGKMKRVVRSVFKYHKCLLMASRQLGKSTIAACLLEWAANFYPRTPSIILNANKSYALENLEKIKFIHRSLPNFLRSPLKYKGDRKTFIEYEHGSLIRVFYPSSTTSADSLARSLTAPILYIDEAAHIRHMREAYGSAQPVLSRAREQAKKNNYPYFILTTSTPNGTVGTGEWFFNMYQFGIDSDLIFDDQDQFTADADELVDHPERNGFVRISFHWSEDPAKDDAWYQQQRRDLNFDQRMINQELDLLFVGSTKCIFEDDYLALLKSIKPYQKVTLPHGTMFSIYEETFNTDDFLLIGADTAKTLTGDYSAIEVFSFANFHQVGEYFGKLGSLTKYSEVLMALTRYLAKIMNNRIILCIENNSMGAAIIEDLENASEDVSDPDHFDYMQFVYTPTFTKRTSEKGRIVEKPKVEAQLGINTNSKTKSMMVSYLFDYLTKNPGAVRSSDLITQLNVIERRVNGAICAQSGQHDDLFMASALCALVRRLAALEYEPLIGVSTYDFQNQQVKKYSDALATNSVDFGNKQGNMVYNEKEGGFEYVNPNDPSSSDGDSSDMFSIF